MTKVLSGERRGRSPDSSKRACSRAGYSTQIRSNGWRSRKLASGDLLTVTAVDPDQEGLRRLDAVHGEVVALLGPPASALIGEIGAAELLGAVREQMGRWPGRVARPEGHPGRLPEWAKLIGRALVVRSLGGRVGAIGHGETVGFVDDVVGRMSG